MGLSCAIYVSVGMARPLIVLMWFAPESPWWLVRHNNLRQAEKSIQRLGNDETKPQANEMVTHMVRTNQLEIDVADAGSGKSRWIDLIRGTDLRRTEIACMAWACQDLCGAVFAGNTAYTFKQAGIDQITALRLGFGNSALMIGANVLSFWLMSQAGRRTLYLSGLSLCFLALILIGVMAVLGIQGNHGAKWAQASIQLVSTLTSF